LQDFGPFETAPGRQVQVLDGSRKRQSGCPDTALELVVGPTSDLDIDEQTKTFLKRQFGIVGTGQLFFQSCPET